MEYRIDDRGIVRNDPKKYFDEMIHKIYSCGLSSFEYYDYCNSLYYAIENKLINDYFYYALALAKTKINDLHPRLKGAEDSALTINMRNLMKTLVSNVIKKQLDDIDIINYFGKMVQNNEESAISFNQYCSYFETLELLIMAEIDSIDCLKYTKFLFDANVELPKTPHDYIKFDRYKKQLAEYINKLQAKKTIQNQTNRKS